MTVRSHAPFPTQLRALLTSARPRRALATAVVLALAAGLSGRPAREIGLVLVTVLLGQVILGWDNDVVDRRRDRRHLRSDKPVARGDLEPANAWFAAACAALLLVPVSIAHGVPAGIAYLGCVALGLVANRLWRTAPWSFLPWAASFALLPAFLSWGGWGGVAAGGPPTWQMVVLAALLGVGVHVWSALPGLVDDRVDHFRSLPLLIALRTGAPRLRLLAALWTALVGVGILMTGLGPGLRS